MRKRPSPSTPACTKGPPTGRSAYSRKPVTGTGKAELSVPKPRSAIFQTAAIELCCRRKTSVKEAIIETFLAGVSTRRVKGVSELLCGGLVSSGTISNLNK